MSRIVATIFLLSALFANAQHEGGFPYDTRGLLGAWLIDGDSSGGAFDWSGNNRHGAPSALLTNIHDGAYRFQKSTNSYVDLRGYHIPLRSLTNTGFTVAWWQHMTGPVNQDGALSNYQAVISGINASVFDGFFVGLASGAGNTIFLATGFNAFEGGYYDYGTLIYQTNWVHIALTWEPVHLSRVVRYRNGVQYGSPVTGVQFTVNGVGNAARIGNYPTNGAANGGAFSGYLSDVLLYERVLSADEIYEAYNARRRR